MDNQIKIPIIAGISVLTIILFCSAGFLIFNYKIPGKTANPQKIILACTKEAKICPDGSSVVRIEPSCEFAQCPPITTGWKTYEDKNNGFEIKYPKTAIFCTTASTEKNCEFKLSSDSAGLQNCDKTEQRIINGVPMQIKYCGTRGIDAVWASKDGSNNYEFRLLDNTAAQNFFQVLSTFKFTK